MKNLGHGVLAAGLITAALLSSRFDRSGDGISASAAMLPHDDRQAIERFRLSARDSSCMVIKFAASEGEPAKLVADTGCETVLPGLSKLSSWQDVPDGSVLLSDARGAVLAAFAAADGVGYESFKPRLPLMSLRQYE